MMELLKWIMSHIFPCNSEKNIATNKKYTSNERNLMIEALKALKLIHCNLAISCNLFSTNVEKIENIIFTFSHVILIKIKLQKSNAHQMKGNFA